MHRFTVHLALIAYLVGGWLLPATHHHGHVHAPKGCGCSVTDCQINASHSASTLESSAKVCVSSHQRPAQGHEEECGCDHQAKSSMPSRAKSVEPDAGITEVGVEPGTNECGGLCALCCAAGLSDHLDAIDVGTSLTLVSVPTFSESGLPWLLPPQDGGLSPRGPPMG